MRKTTLLRLMSIAATMSLAACAHGVAVPGEAPTALDNWNAAVQVTPTPDEIRLASHPTGLSGNQARALTEFHARWMQAEAAEITVAAPNEGGYRIGTETRAFLVSQGAPSEKVRLIGYDGDAGGPVVVSFRRYTVSTPNCGSFENVASTFGNRAMGNLGCAVTSNMAAQVANPGDLLAPRTMDPADPNRRAVVFDKYRKGEVTSSAKDSQASGAVSQAIQ